MSELPALEGGKPVRETFLPYGKQDITEKDIERVRKVLESDWITTGPTSQEFEKKFASYTGAKFAVAVSSGTAALHISALAAGLEKGKTAITTPLTFAATPNSILYTGAKPKFADIRKDTYNLDPEKVENTINTDTHAIIPVDFAGQPCNLDTFKEITQKNDLILIEDACHAVSAKYKGKHVGSISDMTCFSFHPVKNMTTGEGGMVTTNNPELYELLLMYRNHGINKDANKRFGPEGSWYYEMQLLGYNYRMTDIQAALGIGQLERLDIYHNNRKGVVARYNKELSDVSGITLPHVKKDIEHGWHLYTIQIDNELIKGGRNKIFQALRMENIGVNVHYIPVHLHPYYKECVGTKKDKHHFAENIGERILTIPLHHKMDTQDVSDTIDGIIKVVDHYRK